MKHIAIGTKDIKFLNDINQVLKKIYVRYFIFKDGFVVSFPGDTSVEGGFHFSIIAESEKLFNLLQIDPSSIICFYSNQLYTVVKDQKKNIQSISIDTENGHIYLTTNEGKQHSVGSLSHELTEYRTITSRYAEAKLKYSNLSGEKLDNSVVSLLCDNELAIITKGRYRVRLTKKVIPNIKENMPITISFAETSEKDLFEMTIGTEKDGIECYHSYNCLYY